MKPIKLKVCAFGPYKEQVEVDFDKLGNSGIYLITGDTGSGKTTIFDAISFALYGVSSGSIRENNSLRSDFADDNVKTYVEFEFIHKNTIYKIERVPRYTRNKVRGEGKTSVGGDASLSYLDKVVTGDKNVTEKCIEILGITASQFKQIVMIAQGEFMELLHAKSKDRAVIFRKIFDTGLYKNISEKLKEEYLLRKREYDNIKITLNNYKDNIIWDKEADYELSILDLLCELNEYNNELKQEEENQKKEKIDLDIKYNKIIESISEANIINDSINSLNNCRSKYKELVEKKDFYIEKENRLNLCRVINSSVLPKYERVNNIVKFINDKKEQLETNIKLNNDIVDKYKRIKTKYENISKLNIKLKELTKISNDLDIKLNNLNEVRKLEIELEEKNKILSVLELFDTKKVLDKFIECDKLRKILKKKEFDFNDLTLKYKLLNNDYVNKFDEFLKAQAGIIASELKDNCPCPVCGSLKHPNIAVLSDSILTKDDLDRLKNELDVLGKKLENFVVDINDLKNDINLLNIELKNYDKDMLREKINKFNIELDKKIINNYIKEDIENEIININVLIEDKSKFVEIGETIEKITIEKSNLVEEIDKLEKEIENINNEFQKISLEREKYVIVIDKLNNDVKDLELEYNEYKNDYVLSYQKLGYKEEKDYLEIILDNNYLKKLEEEVKSYNIKVVELESKIDSLEIFVKDNKAIDTNKFVYEKKLLEDKIKIIDVSLKEIHHKLYNNLSVYDNLKNVYDKSNNLEKEVMIYKDLSDTANGNISGKNKLEFEQYVQANYFDKVIVAANKRFSYMTDERYLLARREESLKISDTLGLELEVIDNYTGKKRDVKSLSGGESFKAALSLALGMRDTIQNYAGGIVVDAMFIDEGFGSLDDTSLEQALNAIMLLGQDNKLIGIISHVNELKNRIDKKIIVKKSNVGSSVELIV